MLISSLSLSYLEKLLQKYGLNFQFVTYSDDIVHWHFDGSSNLIILYNHAPEGLFSYIVTGLLQANPSNRAFDEMFKITDLQYANEGMDLNQFLSEVEDIIPISVYDGLSPVKDQKNFFYLYHQDGIISQQKIILNTIPGPEGDVGPAGPPGVDGADWEANVIVLNAPSYTTLCPPDSKNSEIILVNTSTNAVLINLSCACYVTGQVIEIKDISANAFVNNITINSGVGNLIGAAQTFIINTNSDFVRLVLRSISPCVWEILSGDACCIAADIETFLAPINYVPTNTDVKGHLEGIDSKLGLFVTVNSQIVSINSSITTLNTDVNTLQIDLNTVETTVNTHTTQISSITTNLGTLTTTVTNLTSDVVANTADILTLQTDLTTAQTDITTLETRLDVFAPVPVNYTPTGPTLEGHIEGIDTALGISINVVVYNPINYTETGPTVDGHFEGVDTALGLIVSDVSAIEGRIDTFDYTAINFTPFDATLEGQIQGIDDKFNIATLTYGVVGIPTTIPLTNVEPTVYVKVDTSGAGPYTFQLPITVPTHKRRIVFIDTTGNASVQNITLDGNGNLIDGAATYVMVNNDQLTEVVWDGTDWFITHNYVRL